LGIGPNPQSPIPNPQSPIPYTKNDKFNENLIIKLIKKINYSINLFKNGRKYDS